MTKQESEKLQRIHDDVIMVKTLLLGAKNTQDGGLVGDVQNHTQDIKDLNGKFNKLLITLIIIFSSSGVSLWKLLAQ